MTTLSKAFLAMTATCALVSAQTKPAADPLIEGSHGLFTQISGLILRSADKIPENLWSFQATPEVRTIGQLFAHIADASNHICATAVGAKMSTVSVENTMKTKAEIVAALKKEFAGCDADYAAMTPASALQVLDLGGGTKRTRITEMDYEVAHTWEHYGNLVTYMRLKGIIPPSSEPPAK
jgi:uncharacterized damage-inducible protein DinB